jgi:hypothetical protein
MLSSVLEQPATKQRLTQMGYDPVPTGKDTLLEMIRRDTVIARKVIQDANISAN